MRINILLVFSLVSSGLFGKTYDRSYSLRDFSDGSVCSVTIKEDVVNEIITLSTGTSSLKILAALDIETIVVHSEAFLEVKFRVKGGSGTKARRSVVICVSNGAIYKSLDVSSTFVSRLSKTYNSRADSLKLFDEQQHYYVKIEITRTPDGDYKCILDESIDIRSKYSPSDNLFQKQAYELHFDSHGFYFYNVMKLFDRDCQTYSKSQGRIINKAAGEAVPCIQLFETLYVYIEGEWCISADDGTVTCQ